MPSWRQRPEDFAARITQSLQWIVQHMPQSGERSPWSALTPGELSSRIPLTAPTTPEPLEDVLADLRDVIAPGLVRWDAPGYVETETHLIPHRHRQRIQTAMGPKAP